MEIDALDAGVYGGVITKENIKLLICYIINNMEKPLNRNDFCDEMHAEGIANYFELAEAFTDLTRKELIVEVEHGLFSLTPIGKSTIRELKENLPQHIRKRAYIATVKMIRRKKNQEETKVSVEHTDNGEYILTCTILEGAKELLSVKFNFPTFEMAQNAKNIFWDCPHKVYLGIMELLTHKKFEYDENDIPFPDK